MLLEHKIHQNWMERYIFHMESHVAEQLKFARSRRGSKTAQSLEHSITVYAVYHIRRCVLRGDICILGEKCSSDPRPVTSAGVIAVVISPRRHSKVPG